MPRRRTLVAATTAGAVVLVLATNALLGRDRGVAYARGEAGFEQGLPVLVWRALPQVFPEYVPGPGGYLAFGFEWELGEQLPVGLAATEGAVPRIRSTDPAAPGPKAAQGRTLDLDGYRAFLVAVARDPRFSADHLMPTIRYTTRLSLLERLRYRNRIIPETREALLRLAEEP